MDAFESIVAIFLEHKGYWVKKSVKVTLSPEEKRRVGKPSMPRPEIDLIAYKPEKNELLLIEAKSYLDSFGVKFKEISACSQESGKRYKLFTDSTLRKIISSGLKRQLLGLGLIKSNTRISYGLAAGKVYCSDRPKLEKYFKKKKWIFFSPEMIKKGISALRDDGWENDPVTITAKLVLR